MFLKPGGKTEGVGFVGKEVKLVGNLIKLLGKCIGLKENLERALGAEESPSGLGSG